MRIHVAMRKQEDEEQNDLEEGRRDKLRNAAEKPAVSDAEAGSLRDEAGTRRVRKREPTLCPGTCRPDGGRTVRGGWGQGCVAAEHRSGGDRKGMTLRASGALVQWELVSAPSLGSNFRKEVSFVHLHVRSR